MARTSELHPCFQVRVIYIDAERTEFESDDGRVTVKQQLSFYSPCVNRSRTGKNTLISLDLAQQIGGILTIAVDEKRYVAIAPFLKKDAELLLDIAAIPWQMGTASGVKIDLVNIEKFELISDEAL